VNLRCLKALEPGHVLSRSSCFKNYLDVTQIQSHEMQNSIWKHNDGCHCNICFREPLRFNHMRYKINKYTIWKHNSGCHRNIWFREPLPLFSMIFIGCKCEESDTPNFLRAYMYATIATSNLHRATPINPLLLQHSKSANLAVCQGTFTFYKACAADL